jgi:hypothetical protein
MVKTKPIHGVYTWDNDERWGQPFEEKSDILLYTKPMWDTLPEAMPEFAGPIPVKKKLTEKRWIWGGEAK